MSRPVILALVIALLFALPALAQEDLSWMEVTPTCAPGGLNVTFAARGSSWNDHLPRDIVARTYDWQTRMAGAQIAGPATIDDDGVTVNVPLQGTDWVIFQFTDTGTLFSGLHLAEIGCNQAPPPDNPHGLATLGECALLNVDIAQRPDLAGAAYRVIDTDTGLTIIAAAISAYGDLSFLVVPEYYPTNHVYRLELADGGWLYTVERQATYTDQTPYCIVLGVGAVPLRAK